MATKPKAREWRTQAVRVIREVLETIPDGLSRRDVRNALDARYPFGLKQYHPYKVWCSAVRDMVGVDAGEAEMPLDFTPAKDVPEKYLPFLEAIAATPWDEAPRLIFADYLEERGDQRAATARDPFHAFLGNGVLRAAISRRLGGRPNHLAHNAWVSLLEDHLCSQTLLLRFPEVDRAITVEQSNRVLALFRKKKHEATPRGGSG